MVHHDQVNLSVAEILVGVVCLISRPIFRRESSLRCSKLLRMRGSNRIITTYKVWSDVMWKGIAEKDLLT